MGGSPCVQHITNAWYHTRAVDSLQSVLHEKCTGSYQTHALSQETTRRISASVLGSSPTGKSSANNNSGQKFRTHLRAIPRAVQRKKGGWVIRIRRIIQSRRTVIKETVRVGCSAKIQIVCHTSQVWNIASDVRTLAALLFVLTMIPQGPFT
jgi:hypothetical protein